MGFQNDFGCFLKRDLLVIGMLISLFVFPQISRSQSKTDTELLESYCAYTSLPREIIYLHLNKTDFLQGEQLGFKAYVLDKHSQRPSLKTSNLYVQILDMDNNVFQEKLLQVKQGVTHGTFRIDSTFTNNNYIVKAFTNWSRNFEEPNTHTQRIRVLDFQETVQQHNAPSGKGLEVSFMPEGGHFIAEALNSVGISVKDSFGLGVPNLKVKLLKDGEEVLKTFTLNEKGLARVLVNPEKESLYKLSLEYQGKEHLFNFPKAEERGFGLILASRKHSLLFNLNTNETTLSALKENNYKLAIHNGSDIKIVRLPKFDNVSNASNIPKEDLFDGLNILTVLDQDNTPLLERLYYYKVTKVKRSIRYESKVEHDSFSIALAYDDVIDQGHLSISVLPAPSIANNSHESIASFIFLSNHLNNAIENVADYFYSETSSEKELDLALLTQGWSTYDWSKIMYFSPQTVFEFEKGIKATIFNRKKKNKNWFVLPNQGIELKKFKPQDSYSLFVFDSLFPYPNDKLKITEIAKNGKFYKPNLNRNTIEFLPNEIPQTNSSLKTLSLKEFKTALTPVGKTLDFSLPMDTDIIALEEVVVTDKKIEDERLRILKTFSLGEVTVFDEQLRKKWFDVITFLNFQPSIHAVNNDVGKISIRNILPGIPPPIVYLDGVLLQSPMLGGMDDLSLLDGLKTEDVDYIEVNSLGLGEGVNGGGGVIRIFTRGYYFNKPKIPYDYSEYGYPITFSRPDEYAVPVYSSYTNNHYFKYGVLGWFPNLSVHGANTVKFKIPHTNLESIKLNIQGFSNNGDIFSEERIIQVE